MELKSFLQNIEGEWIAQRTTYFFETKKLNVQEEKINIMKMTSLDKAQSDLIKDFHHNNQYIAYKIKWNNTLLSKDIYNFFSPGEDTQSGYLNKIEGLCVKRYDFIVHNDKLMALGLRENNLSATENIYVINSNLRISTSTIKESDKYIAISFCSEIRII